jgi:hypothetical protein
VTRVCVMTGGPNPAGLVGRREPLRRRRLSRDDMSQLRLTSVDETRATAGDELIFVAWPPGGTEMIPGVRPNALAMVRGRNAWFYRRGAMRTDAR